MPYAYLHHNEPHKCPFLIWERNHNSPNPVDVKHILDQNKEKKKIKKNSKDPKNGKQI